MIPLWLLERFIDFGFKDCEFCRDIYEAMSRGRQGRLGKLPTSLRRLLAFKRMDEERAAALIQRNYRGYRERRQLEGFGLSASTRWKEALKEC
jgi:hypothetical protein